MQNAHLWRALLGVEKAVIEDIEFDEDEHRSSSLVCSRVAGAGSVRQVRAALTTRV